MRRCPHPCAHISVHVLAHTCTCAHTLLCAPEGRDCPRPSTAPHSLTDLLAAPALLLAVPPLRGAQPFPGGALHSCHLVKAAKRGQVASLALTPLGGWTGR